MSNDLPNRQADINEAQRVMRQITWRASQGEEQHKVAAWKLLEKGLAALERVRVGPTLHNHINTPRKD